MNSFHSIVLLGCHNFTGEEERVSSAVWNEEMEAPRKWSEPSYCACVFEPLPKYMGWVSHVETWCPNGHDSLQPEVSIYLNSPGLGTQWHIPGAPASQEAEAVEITETPK